MAVFFCGGDDELEVLRNVFLVCLKDPASFSGMIAQHGEELCGDLAVMIVDYFSYEAELSFGYLVPE